MRHFRVAMVMLFGLCASLALAQFEGPFGGAGGGGGGAAAGATVTGGQANSVLFVNDAGALGQDNPGLKYDALHNELILGDYDGGVVRPFVDSATTVPATWTNVVGPGFSDVTRAWTIDTDKPVLFHKRVGAASDLTSVQCIGGGSGDKCSTTTAETQLTGGAIHSADVLERNNIGWVAWTTGGTDVKLAKCSNAACTAIDTPITIASSAPAKYSISIAKGYNSDHIGVAWVEDAGSNTRDLYYRRCENPGAVSPCSTLSTAQLLQNVDHTVYDVGITTHSIRLAILNNGGTDYPFVVFNDSIGGSSNDLTLTYCTTATCSANTDTTLSWTAILDNFDIAVSSDGLAAFMAWSAPTRGAHYVKCTNLACSSKTDTNLGNGNAGFGIQRSPDGYLNLFWSNSDLNTATVRRCTNDACSTYVDHNVYNSAFEPANLGEGLHEYGVSERPNGNITVYGITSPPGPYLSALDVGSGLPDVIGVALGTTAHKFSNANLAGDISARAISASDIMRATVGVVAGGTSSLNKLDVHGGSAVGAGYAGLETAPTNGLIVQGRVGAGVAAPDSPLHVSGVLHVDGASGSLPECDSDDDVGKISLYTKSAGASITLCSCRKLASVYTVQSLITGGDCT